MKARKNIKEMRRWCCLLLLMSLCFSAHLAMMSVYAEDEYYNFGSATERADRFEAEDSTSGAKRNQNSPLASGKVLEMGGTSQVTLTVNAETAGDYVLKYAYFTGSSAARMTVNVNGSGAKDMGAMRVNGWASTGTTGTKSGMRMVFYKNYDIKLNAGENKVVITNKANYTNLDFVEFYRADNVYYYPLERQQLGMQYTGERIEAEHGYATNWDTHTGVITYDGNSNISGSQVGLSGTARGPAEMNYIVNAEKAGEYYLQISNAGNQKTGCEQTWKINGEAMTLAFDYDDTSLGNVYQTEHVFTVNLKEGKNAISFTQKTGTVNTDWFKLIEKNDNMNTIIQAEDCTLGAVKSAYKVDKEVEIYPGFTGQRLCTYIDGFVAEFHGSRKGSIAIPVTAPEDGYYDLYVRSYTGSNSAKFLMSVDGENETAYPVRKTGWLSSGLKFYSADNSYRLYLTKGEHTLTIRKDASAYIDFDWFYITKSAIGEGLKGGKLTLEQGVAYNVGDAQIEVSDDGIVSFRDGSIVLNEAGETTVYHKIQMNDKNNYVYKIPYKVVTKKVNIDDVDLLVARNKTVVYNGSKQEYADASAPDGWTIKYYYGDGNFTDVGVYSVTVQFIHDGYSTVRKDVLLTITPADYNGDGLKVEKTEYTYDGTMHMLTAKAPDGWDIVYENNGRKNTGKQTVTVYFSHKNYNTITKEAVLTIK